MKFIRLVLVVLMMLIAGCSGAPTPFAATVPAEQAVSVLPTLTPSDTPTVTPTFTSTYTPSPTLTPTATPTFTPTFTPTITPTLTPTLTLTPSDTPTPIPTATFEDPSDDPNYTPPPTWTPPPADSSLQIDDHYVLRRPIPNAQRDFVDRIYPYGSTAGGRFRVHHGVEFQNPLGTPIIAPANGTVHYAGPDISQIYGPQPNYYGNVVVIAHPTQTTGGRLYTLYGHLSRVDVQTGQTVATGDQLGVVGSEGVALGSHLHFEVRVGDPTCFCATRNPELWIRPYFGWGTLAGRVVDNAGNLLPDVTIQVDNAQGARGLSKYAYTYAGNTVNPDPVFRENFTLGDLRADYYDVTVRIGGRRAFQQVVYIQPNRTTFIEIVLE